MEVSPVIHKLKSQGALADLYRDHPGKTWVLTGGIFDFLLPEHIDLFEFARGKGDSLVVAVEKAGKFTPLEERLEILNAVASVDFLITYSGPAELRPICELAGKVVLNTGFGPFPEHLLPAGKGINFPL